MSKKEESKEGDLSREMKRLGIREEDLAERFVHASGPGGQNVNKVATCVQLRHRPSGITVKCQKARTQAMNRIFARELLVERFKKAEMKKRREEEWEKEKDRRRKRRLSKKAKERMLEAKHRRSEKKNSRRTVDLRRLDEG